MSEPPFTGVGVALVTLFDEDGELDLDATAEHAARLVDLGVRAVVVSGSTGEAAALSAEERGRLLQELDEWGGPLYTGSSALLALAGPLGCTGAILALANVEPEGCIAAFAGDAKAQRRLAGAHHAAPLRFPAGLKELMAARFGTSPV